MGAVDPAFIQALENRPKLDIIEAEGIPLIDLSPLFNSSNTTSSLEELVNEIGTACKNWGFFQVINHGVPVEKRQKMETASREFFGQSLEEKRKVRRDEVRVLGYYDTEHTKNVRDWKEVFDFSMEEPTLVPASYHPEGKDVTEWHNQWPEYPPNLREVCLEYAGEMEKLAYKLMEIIALSLGVPPKRFDSFFVKDQTSFIRLNHYPPCPIPHLALGVGRHKDASALTILFQDDVGGLEVKSKTGEWIRVKPTPDAFIINVGDMIQVWSNDTYESVEHRVMVNSEKERFSIPYFLYPAHYTMVEPLPELVNKKNPAKYKAYNWGKFFVTRKLSNFKKLNVENIQISHFRIV